MAEKIVSSGVLPILAHVLRKKSPLASQVTLLVAEIAREGKTDLLSCTMKVKNMVYKLNKNVQNEVNEWFPVGLCVSWCEGALYSSRTGDSISAFIEQFGPGAVAACGPSDRTHLL